MSEVMKLLSPLRQQLLYEHYNIYDNQNIHFLWSQCLRYLKKKQVLRKYKI